MLDSTTINNISSLMEEESSEFKKYIPEVVLTKIMNADTRAQLTESLLFVLDDKNKRMIDVLVGNLDFFCFKRLLEVIDSESMEIVLSEKNLNGENAVDIWVKQGCNNSKSFLPIIKKIPNNETKVSLITHGVSDMRSDRDQGYHFSLLTHPEIIFSDALDLIKDLSDKDKKTAVLNFSGGKGNKNFLFRSVDRNELDHLINLFNNKKDELELRHYVKRRRLPKRAGHFLGISEDINKFENIEFGAMTEMGSQSEFVSVLREFKPKEFKKEFNEIYEAFQKIENYSLEKFKSYNQGNLVVLSAGWEGHSIMIAAKGPFLVIGNRGEDMHPKGGCVVYYLNKPLTYEDLYFFSMTRDKIQIKNKIKQVVRENAEDKPDIFHIFPLKPQKYGTCVFRSERTVILV